MKRPGMVVVKFELNLCLTPERCYLKRNKPDYQPLFRKGARVSRADSRQTAEFIDMTQEQPVIIACIPVAWT